MLRRRHIFETAVLLLAIALVPAEAQAPAQDTILTVAGGVPNNVSALSVSTEAQTVATDSEGNMYSSSPSLGLVTKISLSGQASTVAGDGSLGYGGDGAAATSAQIGCPVGIAVDAANDVFITDVCYNVIREVNGSTGIIQTIAGNGSTGYFGDGGLATSAELNQPTGAAIDGSGNLFIADSGNNVIREVVCGTGASGCTPPAGQVSGDIYTVAGSGTAGYSGDSALATNASLNAPIGVSSDSTGNLFIADTNNNVVREVVCASSLTSCSPPTGMSAGFIYTLAGDGTAGYLGDGGPAGSAELNQPTGVFVDTSGDIFIADYFNSVVREVTSGNINTVAGDGAAGFNGDGGSAVACSLNYPYGISVNTSGDLIIADSLNNRVRKVSAGIINTVAGNGFVGYSGDGGPALNAQFSIPFALVTASLATDGAGDILLADSGASVVREIVASTGNIQTIAGNGLFGFTGDGGPAASATLSAPAGVAIDNSGDIFIADSGNNVIREISDTSSVITTIAGVGAPGYTGDGGPASHAMLDQPSAVAVDAFGNLLIADTVNNTIREVYCVTGASGCTPPTDETAGYIYTVAGNGIAGFSGDGGSATTAELQQPTGVSVDSAGDIFIADCINNRIREISKGIINTVAGNGAPGYSGNDSVAVSAMLDNPTGVSVDDAGNIFIADTNNNVIREVVCARGAAGCSPPAGETAGDIYTIAGDGTAGFSGDGGHASSAELGLPLGTAIDSSGDLLFSDLYANRVRELTGVANIAAVTVSPSSLSFAMPQVLGGSPQSRTVTLTNPGTYPLAINSISISGSPDFKESSQCGPFPETISPGEACAITATFQASSLGPHTATLTIADSTMNGQQSIPLSGAGIDFAIGPMPGASTSATITQGATASYALQVSVSGSFNPNNPISVAIGCVGAPPNSTCRGPQAPVSATAAGPAMVEVQVLSAQSSTTLPRARPWSPQHAALPSTLGGALLILFIFWMKNSRDRFALYREGSKRLGLATGFTMLVFSVIYLGGCAPGQPRQLSPGTYNLSVQATSGGVSHTAKLTLIVQ